MVAFLVENGADYTILGAKEKTPCDVVEEKGKILKKN